ncbi:MAG: peptidoglycan DD-metalloendopeptidase family protein [Bacteroidales bacterium]|nr:MAG: peptidoglycan DD-metalloendopeptidase family protein [Bacteroidales bacterium]
MNKRKRNAGLIVILIIFLLLLLYFFSVKKRLKSEIVISADYDSVETAEPVKRLYGIPVDSFYVEYGRISKNQNLSGILSGYNLPDGCFNKILEKSKGIFDLRKIRHGNRYTVFLSVDTLYEVRYFVYEHTPVDYILFDLTDSVAIEARKKNVNIVTKTATGTIKSSLWNAIMDKNLEPELAIELSEIYAWTIDFFELQVGDSFRVIYDKHYIDTIVAGLGKIHSAYFRHAQNDYYAIPFVQDSIESYYDLDGNSLRRVFLKSPLRYSRISSKYSHSRLHPILKIRRPHYGVDYSAPVGTPVQSIGDGKVIKVAYDNSAGRMVKIRHNSVYSTSYLHLSRYRKGIKKGAYVKQGDVIGYVGSSGLSTGPHLDFRFYKNNGPIDPFKVEAPPVEPVKEENKQAFDSVKAVTVRRLSSF